MSKSFFSCDSVTHQGKSNTWFTPKWIIDAIGPFDFDPCTETTRPFDTAKFHCESGKIDGLTAQWSGRVWLNPPYGKETPKWLDKLRVHGNGIAIVFTAFETKWGQDHAKTADGILLMAGRVSFIDQFGKTQNNAGKGSCLIAYGNENVKDISKIKGVLVRGLYGR